MASFRTHIVTGSAVGYVGGSVVAINYWFFSDLTPFFVFLSSLIGSMLPDLDSDSGKPVCLLFDLLSLLGGCFAFYFCIQQNDLPVYYQIGIPPIVALIIRYGISTLFKKFTVHRGIFHSLPAALIIVLATAGLLRWFSEMAPLDILVISLAAGAGFVSHLILDEIYSLGFDGGRFKPKNSLGSALAWRSSSVSVTITIYLVIGLLVLIHWYLNIEGVKSLF
jgi:hypothetical protein